jgi:hypothetical protein
VAVLPAAAQVPDAGRDERTPARLATPRPTQPVDWPTIPELSELEPVLRTDAYVVYTTEDSRVLQTYARRWERSVDGIAALVASRLGLAGERPMIHLVFAPAYRGDCPARGLATMRELGEPTVEGEDVPMIAVFVDSSTSEDQVRAVIAHETAHAYTFARGFVGDGVLTEGVANWAPGGLVRRWQGVESWRAQALERLADGTYVSVADPAGLTPDPGEDCLARRDRVYNIRAAFTEWLVGRYGREMVLAMPSFEVQEAQEGSQEPVLRILPDYREATGFDLDELETIWLAELTGRL